MQLVAYGAQDIYLTGNPQITFFKVVYRRHTNFSMETIQQTLNGAATATDNAQSTCTISRNGDLVYKTYVSFVTLADCSNGSKLIKEVELEIGGQRIDRHYQEWNEIWNELSTPESKAIGLKAMALDIGALNTGVVEAQIPLNFWFCRNPGLALPLIALQYHEVKLKFTWGLPGTSVLAAPKVWCDYIYLDTDERRRFAQVSHEYLIEQIQKEDKTIVTATNEKLNFNHPVKELIWTYPAGQTLTKGKLMLNGHDRFSEQSEEYFTLRQPFDYHTAIPRQNLPLQARSQILNQLALSGTVDTRASIELTSGAGTGTTIAFSAANVITAATATFTATLGALAVGDVLAFVMTLVPVLSSTSQVGTIGTDGTGTTYAGLALPASLKAGEIFLGTVKTAAASTAGTVTLDGPLVNAQSVSAATDLATISQLLAATASSVAGKFRVFKLNNNVVAEARTSQMIRKVGVYSFALKPEEHQPSGTCNFSRIDNAKLQFTSSVNSGSLKVYAVNYNVLRIMSGMGGLAYSN